MCVIILEAARFSKRTRRVVKKTDTLFKVGRVRGAPSQYCGAGILPAYALAEDARSVICELSTAKIATSGFRKRISNPARLTPILKATPIAPPVRHRFVRAPRNRPRPRKELSPRHTTRPLAPAAARPREHSEFPNRN